MKKGLFFSLIVACIMCSISLVTAQTICNNETGSQGGYTYEYWKDNGSGCMVLGSGGAFSINWSNINNLLARKGIRPGSKDLKVTYAANYQPNGNSYLCVYGWTRNPLIEYYIVDSWGTWRPPGGQGLMGTLTADGATYDIYRTQRVNQPSIDGTATFYQYWSVRQSKRTSGTITVGDHFNAWAGKGMNMGNFYEVSFCVEGYQSSGTADVYSMSISSGTPAPTRTVTAAPTRTPTQTQNVKKGDVNSDGLINAIDALIISQYAVGLNPANFNPAAADVNCDGNRNIVDALMVSQYYVGLITSFPC